MIIWGGCEKAGVEISILQDFSEPLQNVLCSISPADPKKPLSSKQSLEMHQEARPTRKEQTELCGPLTPVPQHGQATAPRPPHTQDMGFWGPGHGVLGPRSVSTCPSLQAAILDTTSSRLGFIAKGKCSIKL